jgi:hypothetical protein
MPAGWKVARVAVEGLAAPFGSDGLMGGAGRGGLCHSASVVTMSPRGSSTRPRREPPVGNAPPGAKDWNLFLAKEAVDDFDQ